MPTYTTTADLNGDFTIELSNALTSGEIVQVTAQKDGQSKSINIQAPSEPYLPPTPPESGGIATIPMNSYFSADILNGYKTLYDGKGATAETVGNTTTITNNYFKPKQIIRVYQTAKIDLDWFNSIDDSSIVFELEQGEDDGVVTWLGDPQAATKSFVKNILAGLTPPLTIDEQYIYLLLIDSIYYVNGADQASNNAWKVTVNGKTHIYRTNKNYVESN